MINKFTSAINIHKGGGLSYLLLIYPNLDVKNSLILMDERAKNNIPNFNKSKILFLKRGLLRNVRIFQIRLKSLITFKSLRNTNNKDNYQEYYLNGLPPLLRFPFIKMNVYVFCQNRLVLEPINLLEYIRLRQFKIIIYLLIQKFLLKTFIRKNDTIIVQTKTMKESVINFGLRNKIVLHDSIWNISYSIKNNHLFSLSNNELRKNKLIKKIKELYSKNTLYFYPAYFYPHKNHSNLIRAFNRIKENNNKYKLILTISKYQLSNISNLDRSNIVFLNKPSFKEIFHIYKYIDYLIFPSLSESYGLPLLEAKLNNIDIIASDLKYVYDVCIPFLVFNPNSIKDISNKLKISLESNNRSLK